MVALAKVRWVHTPEKKRLKLREEAPHVFKLEGLAGSGGGGGGGWTGTQPPNVSVSRVRGVEANCFIHVGDVG